jgi:hypothetical protein
VDASLSIWLASALQHQLVAQVHAQHVRVPTQLQVGADRTLRSGKMAIWHGLLHVPRVQKRRAIHAEQACTIFPTLLNSVTDGKSACRHAHVRHSGTLDS